MWKIKTLTGAGLVVSLNAQGDLVVEGLRAIDPTGADELRRYIRENKPQIVEELQAQEQGGPAILENCSIENPTPCTRSAAIEILDMARRGFIRLHADSKGGLWWTAPTYENDPGSLAYIADVWREAFPAMFKLLESGGLDHLLPKRITSTTPARPRRKRISPTMLSRRRSAKVWIGEHMPRLLATGWTRKSLFRAGKHPYPVGQWGLCWSANWTNPGLLSVNIEDSGGVAFLLTEPSGREVVQTARPQP